LTPPPGPPTAQRTTNTSPAAPEPFNCRAVRALGVFKRLVGSEDSERPTDTDCRVAGCEMMKNPVKLTAWVRSRLGHRQTPIP
jgi:hypothetical protein